MKNWKSILITVFSFFAIGSMVLLNSCVKDPCSDLQCKNGGSCSDGFCQCPTGYEGAECEITASSRFTGVWVGSMRCDNFPIQADTIRIYPVTGSPDDVTVKMGAGNSSFLNFSGKVATPETHFQTFTSDGNEFHIYITVDGGSMEMYVQTINNNLNTRQNCHFSGIRVANL